MSSTKNDQSSFLPLFLTLNCPSSCFFFFLVVVLFVQLFPKHDWLVLSLVFFEALSACLCSSADSEVEALLQRRRDLLNNESPQEREARLWQLSAQQRERLGTESEPHIDELNVRNLYIIGVSLSEPHINGTCVRELFVCMVRPSLARRSIIHCIGSACKVLHRKV